MPSAAVTGANGFVATELIRQLCARSYHVIGTVRRSFPEAKSHELKTLVSSLPGSLTLVEANLLEPGAFDEALSKCDIVFHVASPFVIDVEDPQRDLITPALDGTRNVFSSVAKHKNSIKKVVLTSSVAAVHDMTQSQAPKNGSLYTEDDWNTTSTAEKEGYWCSKVMAEREAFTLAEQLGVPLASICPNFVLGPVSLPSASGTSIGFMKAFLASRPGGPEPPSGKWTIADVRDVAAAQIAAAENEAAVGRFIISHRAPISARFITDAIKARMPELEIASGGDAECVEQVDNSKAASVLKLELTPAERTIADMAESLVRLGIAA